MDELHDRATPASFPIVTDGGASVEIAYLEALVPVMRRLGVTSHGQTSLGPIPPSTAGDDDQPQRLTAADLERKAREERRRIASASSGGPLKRVESL